MYRTVPQPHSVEESLLRSDFRHKALYLRHVVAQLFLNLLALQDKFAIVKDCSFSKWQGHFIDTFLWKEFTHKRSNSASNSSSIGIISRYCALDYGELTKCLPIRRASYSEPGKLLIFTRINVPYPLHFELGRQRVPRTLQIEQLGVRLPKKRLQA